jgi:hypothetical protein
MKRHLTISLALALAAVLPAPHARAAGVNEELVEARDMADLYQRVCLKAFPNRAAVVATLAASQAKKLDAAAAGAALRGDPGSGWQVTTAVAAYQVTIEDPPFNTCAVSRMTPEGMATAVPYIVAVQDYARGKSLLMGQAEPLQQRTADGADVQVLASPLGGDPNKSPSESSMYVTTNYHGRYSGWATPYVEGGNGVEVKMAHHIAVAH